jgi:hypothetical protein
MHVQSLYIYFTDKLCCTLLMHLRCDRITGCSTVISHTPLAFAYGLTTNMPLGDGMTGLVQHATKQQNNNTYTKTSARSLSASKHQLDQHKSAERAPLVPQRHRNINTNTAYVEDTNVMVSSHSKGREDAPLLTYLRKSPTPIHATSTKTLYTAQTSLHTPSNSSPLTT